VLREHAGLHSHGQALNKSGSRGFETNGLSMMFRRPGPPRQTAAPCRSSADKRPRQATLCRR
jgi:hypothetical protein